MLRVTSLPVDVVAAAEAASWKAVKKGIAVSLILTGIQIVYDLRCARACTAHKKRRKK